MSSQKRFQLFISFFALLGIVLIPMTFQFHGYQLTVTKFLFEGSIDLIANSLGVKLTLRDFSSDSIQLYLLFIVIIFLSITLSLLMSLVKSKTSFHEKLIYFARIASSYYLALILMKYGFDKLFKAQFYLPEPNLLYTPMGKLDKDILFWSTMGVSRGYNLFMGAMEIIPAILLLFQRTRKLGALISFGVLLNILAINVGFDISVKLFSSFLLFLSAFVLFPEMKGLWNYFILNKVSTSAIPYQEDQNIFRFAGLLKTLVVFLLFISSFYPYFKTFNFNDDSAPRPFLHGAYEIRLVSFDNEVVEKSEFPYKRIFIHRDGFLIFQNQDDQMIDYKLEIDQKQNVFHLIDYSLKQKKLNFEFHKKTGMLKLKFNEGSKQTVITCQHINWRKLPVLRNQFHWTVDTQ